MNRLYLFFLILFVGFWACSDDNGQAGVTGTETKIYGQVVDGDGEPVSQAMVKLYQINANRSSLTPDTTGLVEKYAENGEYSFGDLEAGTYVIRALKDSSLLGYSDPITLDVGEVVKINITVVIVIEQNFFITNNDVYNIENVWVIGENSMIRATQDSLTLFSQGQGGEVVYVVVEKEGALDTLVYEVQVGDEGAYLVAKEEGGQSEPVQSSSSGEGPSMGSSENISAVSSSSSALGQLEIEEVLLQNHGKIALGNRNSFVVRGDSLFGTGNSGYGQLCRDDGAVVTRPTLIAEEVKWVAASRLYEEGPNHMAFVKNDGKLYACGYLTWLSAMGNSSVVQSTPLLIDSAVTAVWAGGLEFFTYLIYLKEDGALYGLGDNSFGQLKSVYQTEITSPIKMMDDVVTAAAGAYRSFAVKSDGTLWRFGYPTYEPKPEAPTMEDLITYGIPQKVGSNVREVHSNYYTSHYVTHDGVLYAEGMLEYGSFALPSTFGKIQEGVVHAENGTSVLWALDTLGQLWKYYDETPIEPTYENVNWFAYGENHGVQVDQKATLRAWGFNFAGEFGTGMINSVNYNSEYGPYEMLF